MSDWYTSKKEMTCSSGTLILEFFILKYGLCWTWWKLRRPVFSCHSSFICFSVFQSYFYNDDCFNFNYAQAKAAVGNFKEAEEVFQLIQSEKIKNDYTYLSWLARCCEYTLREG